MIYHKMFQIYGSAEFYGLTPTTKDRVKFVDHGRAHYDFKGKVFSRKNIRNSGGGFSNIFHPEQGQQSTKSILMHDGWCLISQAIFTI